VSEMAGTELDLATRVTALELEVRELRAELRHLMASTSLGLSEVLQATQGAREIAESIMKGTVR
jgi:hypothetical protein